MNILSQQECHSDYIPGQITDSPGIQITIISVPDIVRYPLKHLIQLLPWHYKEGNILLRQWQFRMMLRTQYSIIRRRITIIPLG